MFYSHKMYYIVLFTHVLPCLDMVLCKSDHFVWTGNIALQGFIVEIYKGSVSISLLSIRKLGPPLEALSPPGALGRRHSDAFRRVGSNGLIYPVYDHLTRTFNNPDTG